MILAFKSFSEMFCYILFIEIPVSSLNFKQTAWPVIIIIMNLLVRDLMAGSTTGLSTLFTLVEQWLL